MRALRIPILGLLLCCLAGWPAAEAAPCASGSMTVTASLPNDPGFEGLYKYTFSGSWDTGVANALSHISFLYSLECVCICDPEFAQFADTAGTATGEDDLGNPCDVAYTGLSECQGDPTISSNTPAIKFEIPDGQACETQQTGTGTWCFYSSLPPLAAAAYDDAVVVKFGNAECTLDLTGQLPDCASCEPVPVEPATWGQIKARDP